MADETHCGSAADAEADNMEYALLNPFKLVCVEHIEAPEGALGRDWCRYVLESTCSTITGQRRGSLDDVTAYASDYAERLNARGLKKSPSIWSSRGKKPL